MTTTSNHTDQLVSPALAKIEIRGHTRGAFLTRSLLAAGSVAGLSGLTGWTTAALAQGELSDVDILNFALTLEYLESTYYERALMEIGDFDSEVRALAEEIQANEAEHVTALEATIKDLGGTPTEAPEVDFADAFSDQQAFLDLAITLEDTGVSAYNGAGPMIKSDEVLAAAGSIVQVEARHSALVRLQGGEPPAPLAFDKPSTVEEVTKAIQPFLVAP